MYHYVREGQENLPYFRYLHMEDFKAQLDFLQTQYRIISRDEFLAAIHSASPIENGVILTFDDGLKDHIHVAKELLARDLWGIFYIATAPYNTRQLLDVHRIHMLIGAFGGAKILDYLQQNIDEGMLSHGHVKEFQALTYARQTNDEYTEKSKRILNYFISYDVRTVILRQMMEYFFGKEDKIAENFYLDRSDIKFMHDHGMILGSHSVSHPVFSKLSHDQQVSEIVESFAFLEEITGKLAPKTFCFPYGGFHSFTSESERILKEQGCVFSFNVEQRNITADDILKRPQALPRYDCNQIAHGQASMQFKRPYQL